MDNFRIEVSAPAESDLRLLARYISNELYEPELALKKMDTIDEAILSLRSLPKRNALVLDERLAQLGFRKLLVKNFIVFYIVNEKQNTVNIVRVLYAQREWVNLL